MMANLDYPYIIPTNPKYEKCSDAELSATLATTNSKTEKIDVGLEIVRRISDRCVYNRMNGGEGKYMHNPSADVLLDVAKKGKAYFGSRTVKLDKKVQIIAGLKIIEEFETCKEWILIQKSLAYPNLPQWMAHTLRVLNFYNCEIQWYDIYLPREVKKIAKSRLGPTVLEMVKSSLETGDFYSAIKAVSYGSSSFGFKIEGEEFGFVSTPCYEPLPEYVRINLGRRLLEIAHTMKNEDAIKAMAGKNCPTPVVKDAVFALRMLREEPIKQLKLAPNIEKMSIFRRALNQFKQRKNKNDTTPRDIGAIVLSKQSVAR